MLEVVWVLKNKGTSPINGTRNSRLGHWPFFGHISGVIIMLLTPSV